jgi:hypothetical protein
VVTDNGKPWIAALDYVSATWKVNHIRIIPYNSQSNGIIERQHRSLQRSLKKLCEGNLKIWSQKIAYVAWADRITTSKVTGHSPYYYAHGVEPVTHLDITEATYLSPELSEPLSTEDLIAVRARQLEKRNDDLEAMKNRVWEARKQSAEEFTRKFEATIRDYDFEVGWLVLVKNSAVATNFGRKWIQKYNGPFVVVARTPGGGYTLAEMDGTVSKLRFAAKRVIPYYLRTTAIVPLEEAEEVGEDGLDTREAGLE